MTLETEREELESRADYVRSRLMTTLGELDRRRHEIFDVRLQLRRHARELALVGAGLGLVALSGILTAVNARRIRRANMQRARFRALVRFWEHPDRIASRAKEKPFYLRVLEKVAMSVVTVAIGQLTHRIAKALPEPTPRAPKLTYGATEPATIVES
jgi:hypothetical protein